MRFEVYDHTGRLLSADRMPGRHPGLLRVCFFFDEVILRKEISDAAYAKGESARVNDNYGHDLLAENKEMLLHTFKDICEDENFPRIRDIIKLAVSELEQMLYKYSYDRMECHLSMDNVQRPTPEYVMELRVPDMFSNTSAWYLGRLSKEYIIASALEYWAQQTFVEAAAAWTERKAQLKEQILRSRTYAGSHHKVKPSII